MAQHRIGDVKYARPIWLLADNVTEGRIDGVPEWGNTNPTAASMEVMDGGRFAKITMLAAGTFQISAKGDANLITGPGNERFITLLTDMEEVLGEEVQTGRIDLLNEAPA